MNQFVVFDLTIHWHRPLGHLSVARIGQVDFAARRSVFDGVCEGGGQQPIFVVSQSLEESSQPAFSVNVFLGVGPSTKFFAVVTKDNHTVGATLGEHPAVLHGFFWFGKRNQIPQVLAAGEYFDGLAFVFGDKVAGQFFVFQTRATEMIVVQNGIVDSSFGDRTRQ